MISQMPATTFERRWKALITNGGWGIFGAYQKESVISLSNSMNYYGHVDSEIGLLLMGDAAIVHSWRGTDDEPATMKNLERALGQDLPGLPIRISRKTGVIWDMAGAGTCDLFIDESQGKIAMVRCRLDEADDVETENSDDKQPQIIETLSFSAAELGLPFAEFKVTSGHLAVICAAEAGSCIQGTPDSNYRIVPEEMLQKSSGVVFRFPNGRYQCYHDTVNYNENEASRCHIQRIAI